MGGSRRVDDSINTAWRAARDTRRFLILNEAFSNIAKKYAVDSSQGALARFEGDVHYRKAVRRITNQPFHLGFSQEELGEFESTVQAFIKSTGIEIESEKILREKGAQKVMESLGDTYQALSSVQKEGVVQDLLASYERVATESCLIDPCIKAKQVVSELEKWVEKAYVDQPLIEELKKLRMDLQSLEFKTSFSALTKGEEFFTQKIQPSKFYARFKIQNKIPASAPISEQIQVFLTAYQGYRSNPETIPSNLKSHFSAVEEDVHLLDQQQNGTISQEELEALKENVKKYTSQFPSEVKKRNKQLLEQKIVSNGKLTGFGIKFWAVQSKIITLKNFQNQGVHTHILKAVQGAFFSDEQVKKIVSGVFNTLKESYLKENGCLDAGKEIMDRIQRSSRSEELVKGVFEQVCALVRSSGLIQNIYDAMYFNDFNYISSYTFEFGAHEEAFNQAIERGNLVVIGYFVKYVYSNTVYIAATKAMMSQNIDLLTILATRITKNSANELALEAGKENKLQSLDFFAKRYPISSVLDELLVRAALDNNLTLLSHLMSLKNEQVLRDERNLPKGASAISAKAKCRAIDKVAAAGNIEAVKILLQDPEFFKEGALFAVTLAAEKGQLQTFSYLIGEIEKKKLPFNYGMPLIAAAEHGHREMVEKLLEKGIPRDRIEWALCKAAENGRTLVIDFLIDIDGITPKIKGMALMLAARNGHEGSIRRILRSGDISTNDRRRAIFEAIRHGKLLAIRALS